MKFKCSFDDRDVVVSAEPEAAGLLARLRGKGDVPDLQALKPEELDLAFAIADLRALAAALRLELSVSSSEIRLPHRLAASLDSSTAAVLGLPRLTDLLLRTDAEGLLGSSGFKLRYEWIRQGQRVFPKRSGSILSMGGQHYRIPLWMMEALDVADGFQPGKGDANDWEALARFRQALEPGVSMALGEVSARSSMTDFLSGLEVRLADSFSISPSGTEDFEVVPFSRQRIRAEDGELEAGSVSEDQSEIAGQELQRFQSQVRSRGALAAYRLSPGNYLVIDRAAAPALDVMARMQKAPPAERRAFIQNPQRLISEAVERDLRDSGKLDGLSDAGQQEAIDTAASPLFIETAEFSERVTGIIAYQKPDQEITGSGTTWLPEEFVQILKEAIAPLGHKELTSLRDQVIAGIAAGEQHVNFGAIELPARPEAVALLNGKISEKEIAGIGEPEQLPNTPSGPMVLDTKDNFEDLKWHAGLRPRQSVIPATVPSTILTPLKEHQRASFEWQASAWHTGLPGVLNADEQGLGKTLQTITFLAWLKDNMAQSQAMPRGPVLIVAPTSLLENWQMEVRNHMQEPGLGHVIRLFGSGISSQKKSGYSGKDTDDGIAKLDLSALHEAIEDNRAHRYWVLTTYTTLTNYQHSLGRIRFAATVFDEIQALKNPFSLRAKAAGSMNTDFCIGLTGTPIENTTVDLWAIMDRIAPGALGTLKEFRERYADPTPESMRELYQRTFEPSGGEPALAIRRIKDMVARDLPEKTRRLHPRLMPAIQATVYDDAKLKLASGGLGAQLKMLHHIRSVSVHPNMHAATDNATFITESARLSAAVSILRSIAEKRERALVFIEHRQMQYRFVELIKAEFGLKQIDLINGDTPIQKRQAIVNRFQRHLEVDGGFDLLVLGPKAAGTGLTLTAATHVIHLSRWWNPAVEEQCNDRVHRLGQTRPVSVHLPMAIHPEYREQTFDCLLQSLMNRKRRLAAAALWPMGDTQSDISELQHLLSDSPTRQAGDAIAGSMHAMFERDGLPPPDMQPDGSIRLP